MTRTLDLVVIGTGVAGGHVASECAAAGWKVAIVDRQPFGGTCALRGCEPKRILFDAANVAALEDHLLRQCVYQKPCVMHWSALIAFKQQFTEPVPEASEKKFRERGIITLHGHARFTGPNTLTVNGDTLQANRICIATGAHPRPLNIPGQELVTTSDQLMELDTLPQSILFIGGGYVSSELANITARVGAEVTIIDRGNRLLKRFDPDLVDQLILAMRDANIDVRLNEEVVSVERTNDELYVQLSTGQTLTTQCAVHGAGRVANIDDLNLEAGGIERDEFGIRVLSTLQSVSNPAVYAAGDAASLGEPLTPVAQIQAAAVARNLLSNEAIIPDDRAVPSVAFTIPPLARVGLSEQQAQEQGLAMRIAHEETGSWQTNRRLGIKHAGYKIVIDQKTDQILGAHLLGHHAEEMINLFAMAIRHHLTAAQLRETIYAFPTAGADVPAMLRED